MTNINNIDEWMHKAFNLIDMDCQAVPVAAIIVHDYKIIGHGINALDNPIMHAEIVAINHVLQRYNKYILKNATMYVTLEPCHMCMHAIGLARIPNVYFSAYNTENKQPFNTNFYGGICEQKGSKIISRFFQGIRL